MIDGLSIRGPQRETSECLVHPCEDCPKA